MESLALAELFGFDMGDRRADPAVALGAELRHRTFWLANSAGD